MVYLLLTTSYKDDMTDNLKDNIANTMIKLSRKKKVDKITVTDLANACHISRQTFYYYYPVFWLLESRQG